MKFFGISAAILMILSGIFIKGCVSADYEYSRKIGSFWNLSVKASTLQLKADYLNRFVAAVDSAHLSGNNAIIFPTPDNSVEQNLTTLHSLQQRMAEIRNMDVTSFAYQQAISQITAQEQDEAVNMLGVIEGRWYLNNHLIYWDWIGILIGLGLLGGTLVFGGIFLSLWADA